MHVQYLEDVGGGVLVSRNVTPGQPLPATLSGVPGATESSLAALKLATDGIAADITLIKGSTATAATKLTAIEGNVSDAPVKGPPAVVVSAAIASSAATYAAGQLIGGKLTFVAMVRANGLDVSLQEATLQWKSLQTFAADLVIFHTDPAGTTFTDHAAFTVAAADFDKIATVLSFVAGNWVALGTPSFAEVVAQGRTVKAAAGATTLYGALICRGTPTLAANEGNAVLKGYPS